MRLIVLGCIVFLLNSCKSLVINRLYTGDLIFVEAKKEGLSGAINNVTQKDKSEAFDHIGLLKKEGAAYFVLHADNKGGSQKQLLKNFIDQQSQGQRRIFVYRLKDQYKNTIPNAVVSAENMLGKPYNFDYILSDDAYYCSDYIERAFRKDHIFTLEPMTFKDPKTGTFDVFWRAFYEERNLKIPEGELGCNPNGLAKSEKIYRVRELK